MLYIEKLHVDKGFKTKQLRTFSQSLTNVHKERCFLNWGSEKEQSVPRMNLLIG
jgi:hypothetical protein